MIGMQYQSFDISQSYITFADMKGASVFVFWIVLAMVCFQSCTIEKRHYMSGYHVDWNRCKGAKIAKEQPSVSKHESLIQTAKIEQTADSAADVSSHLPFSETSVLQAPGQAISPEPVRSKSSLNERMARPLKFNMWPQPWIVKVAGAQKKTLQDYNKIGVGFGMVAFVLSVLCLFAFFLAVVFAEGWAALGWIAIAIVFAVATLLFTAIAQTIFWKNGDGIPAFMILPLIISVFAIYVMVRLLIDRFMRV